MDEAFHRAVFAPSVRESTGTERAVAEPDTGCPARGERPRGYPSEDALAAGLPRARGATGVINEGGESSSADRASAGMNRYR